ncbi:uncharacterized protein EURHEDRAFT_406007 [Aspergillus ruber CBS 135680]|uniref:DUF605-domain-containing protein n=1 Tax=Aspergillus ruber (strain CBS 135680) TaxID=1388766 RepID=A0A017S5W1_ASPRC|nr:DUF605-domain-containing protein [Aspergillus ruber CBS 135680]EYE91520.1 DUF605-domain-containing protein [Aspergillus ruber CBS 135680]
MNNIPAALRSADIGRFAARAAQVERVKPAVAYWCNFWIVNQIIEKGLHTADDETKLYTTNLVDKLEQVKSENADNDTITDNVAAHAYVEQFALEVFNRADTTMSANKVTKQTADTFQAAATFLELCQIWNAPDAETAAKIKFAKYHAVRIVKALKAGEDPNATNPVRQQEWEDVEEEGPAEQDVQAFDESVAQRAAQPSVEDVPDDSTSASPNLPAAPQNLPTSPSAEEPGLNLPSAPETIGSTPNLPDTPSNLGASQPAPPPISPSNPPDVPYDPSSFYSKPPTNTATPPPAQPSPGIPAVSRTAPQPAPAAAPTPVPVPAPVPTATPASGPSSNLQDADDQTIALAQKHARWAVSALTFDDVNTAIKELKSSLKCLGAE